MKFSVLVEITMTCKISIELWLTSRKLLNDTCMREARDTFQEIVESSITSLNNFGTKTQYIYSLRIIFNLYTSGFCQSCQIIWRKSWKTAVFIWFKICIQHIVLPPFVDLKNNRAARAPCDRFTQLMAWQWLTVTVTAYNSKFLYLVYGRKYFCVMLLFPLIKFDLSLQQTLDHGISDHNMALLESQCGSSQLRM